MPGDPSLPRTRGSVVPAVFLEDSHTSAGSRHRGMEARRYRSFPLSQVTGVHSEASAFSSISSLPLYLT